MNKLLGLALALGLTATGAAAQEVTLRMSNWLPPTHPIIANIIVPWSEQLSEATDGRVAVQILDAPLGPPPAGFDLAQTGVVDIMYGIHGYTPGRFALSDLPELPFLTPSATAGSVAYWRLYEEMFADKDEHRGTKVIGLMTHGPGMLYLQDTDVTSMEAMAGAKVRVSGTVPNELAAQMGMVALQAPASQAYELISGGVADGIMFPAESAVFFNLDDILTDALRVDGGLYNVSFFFVMNQGKYDSLSEADRAAIDSLSGEAFARIAGKGWDDADRAAMAEMEGKITFVDASAEQMETLTSAADTVYAAVRERIESKGVDFDAALAFYKAEIEKVAAE